MIETEQQRRWWFATHPEFSSSEARRKSIIYGDDDDGDVKPSLKVADALMDELLKHTKNDFWIDVFKEVKSRYGIEAAWKTAVESQPHSQGDEESPLTHDEPGPASGEDWWSEQPSGHPAAWRDAYDQYEDVLDNVDRLLAEDPAKEAAIRLLMEAGWSRRQAEERWAVFERSDNIARVAADAVIDALTSLAGGAGRAISASELAAVGRRLPRLPPKGTPEYAKIQAARTLGIRRKKAQELADIQAGGKGSGVWTERELEGIRETGKFPAGTEWHHDPTVANRPDLAADPKVVHPVRGGRKGHFDAHDRDWRNPRK